jgi:branched-chain amino acid transport system ATP-binding protein
VEEENRRRREGGHAMTTTAVSLESKPVLDARDLTIVFGGLTAVDSFNLKVMPRSVVGLIGPNGAGKTTVFNLLTGVYLPTRGGLSLNGRELTGSKPFDIAAAGVARTFQNIRLFKELTVLDNVRIGFHVRHAYGLWAPLLQSRAFTAAEKRIEAEAIALLAIFGLQDRRDEIAKNLSYGDQRRVEIARALAVGPKLLLLDEPAAGMNTKEAQTLMETIHHLRDRFELAVVLIEHNMQVVMGICEEITVLNYGKTIAVGAAAAVQADPAVIAAYLGTEEKIRA